MGNSVADGREGDFHNQFGDRTGQRAHKALKNRPAEAVPENRREEHKHDYGKDEIVQKLTDKGGNICSRRKRRFAVWISPEKAADQKVQHVVDDAGSEKRDRASEKNKPCAAENAVERREIARIGRNGGSDKKDEAGQKIDDRRKNGDAVGRFGAEMLCDDVHAHKRQPRNQYTAVKRNPIDLKQRFVRKQIH